MRLCRSHSLHIDRLGDELAIDVELSAIGAIASTVLLIFQLIRGEQVRAKGEKDRRLADLRLDLKTFLKNVLSWYNEIARFGSDALHDFRSGDETRIKSRLDEYRRLLDSIMRKDEFRSKCRIFVNDQIPIYYRALSDKKLRDALMSLAHRYDDFENRALYSKDALGRLFNWWDYRSSEDRALLIQSVENSLDSFERFKNQLVEAKIE